MRSKLSTVCHQRQNRLPPPFNTERLQDPAVANNYVQQLEASLPTEKELGAASLNAVFKQKKRQLEDRDRD